MQHNDIAAICRKIVAETFNIKEYDISVVPWDGIIYNFAQIANQYNYPEATIDKKFREHIADIQRELHDFWVTSMQREHDDVVLLYRKSHGRLRSSARERYKLAMQREHDGLCRPLR